MIVVGYKMLCCNDVDEVKGVCLCKSILCFYVKVVNYVRKMNHKESN